MSEVGSWWRMGLMALMSWGGRRTRGRWGSRWRTFWLTPSGHGRCREYSRLLYWWLQLVHRVPSLEGVRDKLGLGCGDSGAGGGGGGDVEAGAGGKLGISMFGWGGGLLPLPPTPCWSLSCLTRLRKWENDLWQILHSKSEFISTTTSLPPEGWNDYNTVGANKNCTLVFVNVSAQGASILKISVPIIKRRSWRFQNTPNLLNLINFKPSYNNLKKMEDLQNLGSYSILGTFSFFAVFLANTHQKVDFWRCFRIVRISSWWWAQRFSKLMQKWQKIEVEVGNPHLERDRKVENWFVL